MPTLRRVRRSTVMRRLYIVHCTIISKYASPLRFEFKFCTRSTGSPLLRHSFETLKHLESGYPSDSTEFMNNCKNIRMKKKVGKLLFVLAFFRVLGSG